MTAIRPIASTSSAAGSSTGLGYVPASSGESAEGIKEGRKDGDLEIRLEFGGGLHLLFSSRPRHTIHLPPLMPTSDDNSSTLEPTTIKHLIKWMKKNLVSEREEMFSDSDTVRPGILVLVNDADWELEGELEYKLQDRDEIVFISTLHGG